MMKCHFATTFLPKTYNPSLTMRKASDTSHFRDSQHNLVYYSSKLSKSSKMRNLNNCHSQEELKKPCKLKAMWSPE